MDFMNQKEKKNGKADGKNGREWASARDGRMCVMLERERDRRWRSMTAVRIALRMISMKTFLCESLASSTAEHLKHGKQKILNLRATTFLIFLAMMSRKISPLTRHPESKKVNEANFGEAQSTCTDCTSPVIFHFPLKHVLCWSQSRNGNVCRSLRLEERRLR